MNRRKFFQSLAAVAVAPALAAPEPFRLRYILSSALYGEMPLDTILPEVAKAGCEAIDIWCKVHGNQREQITEMGDEAFAALLKKYGTKLGVSTRYPLGPLGLQDEMAWVQKLGGKVIVTGSKGPKDPEGDVAKEAVKKFIEEMKPHVARAEELGVTIAIENHVGQAVYHPDSLRYFAEFNRSANLGIAFAPHHLYRWAGEIPKLIRDL
ncbi:MAG: TIM barrel protein, partial [Chthoniobacteraceae bacterium]